MDIADTNVMERMCRDFLCRAGAEEKTAAVFLKLLRNMKNGDTCLELSEEEKEAVGHFAGVSAAPDDSGLFILDGNLLFTRRCWSYEQTVIARLSAMNDGISQEEIAIPAEPPFDGLHHCQKQAVKMMCGKRFCILTGGPGTGKTYTIARAVKLALRNAPAPLRIGLVAPTGKAAARVNETMEQEIQTLGLTGVEKASTLHAMLGTDHTWVRFKHNRENPLELDWVIVDEASMVDLPMMAKLLEALPEGCRLTLVGDAHQLTSVEPGRVFGDLCRHPEFPQCELTTSTRFPEGGVIDHFAKAVNAGKDSEALALLHQPQELLHFNAISGARHDFPWVGTDFGEEILRRMADFVCQTDPVEALKRVNRCRVLCAMRQGGYGTEKINAYVMHLLERRYPVYPIPVMVTRNHPGLEVYNGDVGVVMSTEEDRLWLPGRSLPLALLPEHEIAFASTIHKAQGSEYENVVLVLPSDSALRQYSQGRSLLTRELLYTAITRTRQAVYLYGGEDAIRQCCRTELLRRTGLGKQFSR